MNSAPGAWPLTAAGVQAAPQRCGECAATTPTTEGGGIWRCASCNMPRLEMPGTEMPSEIAGEIGIEWPADAGAVQPGVLRAIPGWRVLPFDGAGMITTIRSLTVRCSPEHGVWADAIVFTDAGGRPILHPADETLAGFTLNIGEDGQPTEGRFAFLVTHMRVREAATTSAAGASAGPAAS